MNTMKTVYVVVSETDFYGPETRRAVVPGEYETREAAEKAAEAYDPDYDPKYGCHQLGHNQASATVGRVAELVTDQFDANDWCSFEVCAADLYEAAARYEKEAARRKEAEESGEDVCYDDPLDRAFAASDYVVGESGQELYRVL